MPGGAPPTLEQLLADLSGEGTATTCRGSRVGEYLITSFHGAPCDPPIRLRVDEVSFRTLMEAMAEQDLTELWPDVDRCTAAYRLFLVNVDEEIQKHGGAVELLEISIRRGVAQMVAFPSDRDPEEGLPPLDGGPYAWR